MKTLNYSFLFLCFIASIASAEKPSRSDPLVKQKIVEAINYNFDACNREDIDDLMDSCADAMPRREEFRKESMQVFKEKDIHYSLVDVELIELKYPNAVVKITQNSYTKNRTSKDKSRAYYRNQTALVTQEECVEYLSTLKCEKGKWKLCSIISEVKPVKKAEQEDETNEENSEEEFEEENSNCVGGNCRLPNFTNILEEYDFKPPSRF